MPMTSNWSTLSTSRAYIGEYIERVFSKKNRKDFSERKP
jgi:hypothetical protein